MSRQEATEATTLEPPAGAFTMSLLGELAVGDLDIAAFVTARRAHLGGIDDEAGLMTAVAAHARFPISAVA